MQYRFLGRTGLKVSAISLGGWLTYGGHVGNEMAFECMKAAFDAGINFFDTAEGYAGGEAEKVLGEAIKRFGWKQNDLVISTKLYWGNKQAVDPTNPLNNNGLSRKHILEGMAASLKRLDLPYVDVVFAHRPDRHTPMEEIVRAFDYLINTGKAFYWGTSEWSASEIAEAWRVADKLGLIGPVCEQPQYNVLTRERVEKEFRWLYDAHGTGLTVFSPLKQGILTGKYNAPATSAATGGTGDQQQQPPEGSRFAVQNDQFIENFRKNNIGTADWTRQLQQVDALAQIARQLGVSTAQLALAWVLKNPNVSSAIIGASRPAQVVENVGALAVIDKLTPEVMAKIDEAVETKPAEEPLRF